MPGLSGRVLVVDDSKAIRQLIRVNLELEGFEVVTAADGAECLDVVHAVRPDVITLDVVMPRLNGLRTAALLRADHRTRALPVAIISACPLCEVEREEEAAVDGFLAKPFEPADLVSLVRRLAAGVPRPRSTGRTRTTGGARSAEGGRSSSGHDVPPSGRGPYPGFPVSGTHVPGRRSPGRALP
ncbi:response regulator [Streptomyces meridianus]|uniref:Response regulator n=1 Tax=Streptomyces meridianus TaxID=2938945 RepID=A0ABT0X7A7_9ACTN|nr:response regulator [Streptomyces meridianus]MCM2578180.1 response regulator [Streptomyces meridianus]